MMELGTVREDATGGEEGIIDDGVGHCKRGRYGRGRRPGEIDQSVDCECIHTRTYT